MLSGCAGNCWQSFQIQNKIFYRPIISQSFQWRPFRGRNRFFLFSFGVILTLADYSDYWTLNIAIEQLDCKKYPFPISANSRGPILHKVSAKWYRNNCWDFEISIMMKFWFINKISEQVCEQYLNRFFLLQKWLFSEHKRKCFPAIKFALDSRKRETKMRANE